LINELNEIERATLRVIKSMRDKNGMTPTQRDLVAQLGVTQTAIRFRLKSLERKGFVKLIPRASRGIILINASN
jgi:DNA-binding MarR family transcriptional regulator